MNKLLLYILALLLALPATAQQIAIDSVARTAPNGQKCDGYSSLLELPKKQVSKYIGKSLAVYGKNLSKKGIFMYEDAEVEGLQWPATVMAELTSPQKGQTLVWMGIMRNGESFMQARKVLYDAVFHIYAAEAGKKEAVAEKAHQKALDERTALGKSYIANENAFKKLTERLAKAINDQEKLKQQVAAQEVQVAEKQAKLNQLSASQGNAKDLEHAHKEYAKALKSKRLLEKKTASNSNMQVSLEGKLQQNLLEKTRLENDIVRNKEQIAVLKERWDLFKTQRENIK